MDGRTAETGDVYLDRQADVAVLKVKLPPELIFAVQPLALGELPADVHTGEFDCARGPSFDWTAYPVVLDSPVRPVAPDPNEVYVPTDQVPMPGCSGAPVVVYSQGKPAAVGVLNYALWDPAGLGYVRAGEVERFLDEVRRGGVPGVNGR
ncbi:MAG: serine protease [Chloroflexi bacterium]|nr:serine protease [Chloroflexota bacterium]